MIYRLAVVFVCLSLIWPTQASSDPVVQVETHETRGSAYERGLQHGRRFKDLIHKDFAKPKGSAWAYSISFFNRRPEVLVRFVKRLQALPHGQELIDEMQGIAEGAEMRFTDIAALNFTFDLGDREEACSAAMMPRTMDGPLLLNTLDHFPVAKHERGYPVAEQVAYPTHGHAMVFLHNVGTVWVHRGLNDAGLACGDTSGGLGAPRNGMNYGGMFYGVLTRYAIQFLETTDEAVAFITGYKSIAKGINIPLLDRSGNAAVIEFASMAVGVRRSKDQPIYVTNFFQTDVFPKYEKGIEMMPYMINARARYDRLGEIFSQTPTDQYNLRLAQQIVTDTNGGKQGQICQDNGVMYTTCAAVFNCEDAVAYLYTNQPNQVEPVIVALDASRKPKDGASTPQSAQVQAVVTAQPMEIRPRSENIRDLTVCELTPSRLTVKTAGTERIVYTRLAQIRIEIPGTFSDVSDDAMTSLVGKKLSDEPTFEARRITTERPPSAFALGRVVGTASAGEASGLFAQSNGQFTLTYDKDLPPAKITLAPDHQVIVSHRTTPAFLVEHAAQIVGKLPVDVSGTTMNEGEPLTAAWVIFHATTDQAAALGLKN